MSLKSRLAIRKLARLVLTAKVSQKYHLSSLPKQIQNQANHGPVLLRAALSKTPRLHIQDRKILQSKSRVISRV